MQSTIIWTLYCSHFSWILVLAILVYNGSHAGDTQGSRQAVGEEEGGGVSWRDALEEQRHEPGATGMSQEPMYG